MKPQDIVVLSKILVLHNTKVPIAELAGALGMSASETHAAIKRCELSGLLRADEWQIHRTNAEEFILHGLKYAFPAVIGPPERGIPTAHSAPPLSLKIISDVDDLYVWPYAQGRSRGTSIQPLYSSVPKAVLNDESLYEFLALIDALRIGRVRERQIAEEELMQRIRQGSEK
jgi:DNA-binding Lrp family transcriptional regulator